MSDPETPARAAADNTALVDRVARNFERKALGARISGTIFVVLAISIGLLITFTFLNYSIPGKFLAFFPVPPMNADVDVPLYQFVLNGIIRFGAILMALYVMQITVNLSRYQFRLSDHLSVSADILRISAGNTNSYKAYATHMLPKVEFGKMPEPLMQQIAVKALDVADKVAKKSP